MNNTITLNGLTFSVTTRHDDHNGAPWKEHDARGIVSDWTTRAKRPGERVLASDRGSRLYYDVEATTAIAIRDSWGPKQDGLTALQNAAAAVESDYEYCRGWANDDWSWCGVIVTLQDVDGDDTRESESLWGIESNSGAHLNEVALELAGEIAARIGDATSLCVKVR
jgi:hypothetical protein